MSSGTQDRLSSEQKGNEIIEEGMGREKKRNEPNVWCCSGREGNLLNNLHSTVWGSKIQTKKWSWAEPWERQTSLVTRKKHFSEDIEIEGNNVIEEE